VTHPVRGGGLPAPVADGLADACGVAVAGARSVSGGDINRAFAVSLADGREVFVKWRPDAPAGDFASEAAGLAWLAAPRALAVPAVVALADAVDAPPGWRWLALQWVPPGRLEAGGERALGRGLAALHAAGAPAFGAAPPQAPAGDDGGPAVLRIGPLVLDGEPQADWPAFYAEHRLRPLARIAHDAGALPGGAVGDIERVCDRLDTFAGPAEPPARLHGDLWSGNVLAGRDGQPWLIDPAAYGGHREVDLAMLALFGSPPSVARVREAYEEVSPLTEGHEERVGLWQLFPLLVHAALFGGGYGHSAHAVARRYVG
jgi:fructosamine-3-kinase